MNIRKGILLSFAILGAVLCGSHAPVGAYDAQVAIDGAITKPISPYIWGANYAATDQSQQNTILAINQDRMREMRLQMFRYSGGCMTDAFLYRDPTAPPDLDNPSLIPAVMQYQLGGAPVSFRVPSAVSVQNLIKNASGLNAEVIHPVPMPLVDRPVACYFDIIGQAVGIGDTEAIFTNITDFVSENPTIQYLELGNKHQYTLTTAAEQAMFRNLALRIAIGVKAINQNIQIGLTDVLIPERATRAAWATMVSDLVAVNTCGPTGTSPCFNYVLDQPYIVTEFPQYAATAILEPQLIQRVGEFAGKGYGMGEWNLWSCFTGAATPGFTQFAQTAGHGLFTAESLLVMAKTGVRYGLYYDYSTVSPLSQANRCGLLADTNTLSPSGSAFAFTSLLAGGTEFGTTVTGTGITTSIQDTGCPTTRQTLCGNTPSNQSWLTVYTGTDGDQTTLHIFFVNRNSAVDGTADATVDIANFDSITVGAQAVLSRLRANSLTGALTEETAGTLTLTDPDQFTVSDLPPLSITRLSVPLNTFAAQTPAHVLCNGTTGKGIMHTTESYIGAANNRFDLPIPAGRVAPVLNARDGFGNPLFIRGNDCSQYYDLTDREIDLFQEVGVRYVIISGGAAAWYNIVNPTNPDIGPMTRDGLGNINPTFYNRDTFNYRKLDEWIYKLTQANIIPVLQIWGTPTALSGSPAIAPASCSTRTRASFFEPYNVPPLDNQTYANFVQSLAVRYDGQRPIFVPFSDAPPQTLKVDFFMLWTQPDNAEYWTGTIDQYLVMNNIAYDRIKQVRPDSIVISGNFSTTAVANQFVERVARITDPAAPALLQTDVLGFHMFPANIAEFNATPSVVTTNIVNLLLEPMDASQQRQLRGKPVFIAGTGYRSTWENQFGVNEIVPPMDPALKSTRYLTLVNAAINTNNRTDRYANRVVGLTAFGMYNPYRVWGSGLVDHLDIADDQIVREPSFAIFRDAVFRCTPRTPPPRGNEIPDRATLWGIPPKYIKPCADQTLYYILASAAYIMLYRFAIQINKDFSNWVIILFFILGGIIGYHLCFFELGFVMAMAASIFMWEP